MVRAIELINLGGAGTIDFQKILNLITAVKGVVWAYLTYGPTDIVAQVEANDLGGITKVVQQIGSIPGVQNSDTRIIAS